VGRKIGVLLVSREYAAKHPVGSVCPPSPRVDIIAIIALNVCVMASLTIRNLDEEVKRRLRMRGARNGRSMEAEARALLSKGVMERLVDPGPTLEREAKGAFGHMVGIWKGRMSSDELMALTRGED